MNKSEIRKHIKLLKSQLTAVEKSKASDDAFDFLERTSYFKEARNILLYYSLPDELSTGKFIEKWYRYKNIYLPRVNGDMLDILPYSPDNLHSGSYNILEPTGSKLYDIKNIDLAIIPAVAYDFTGNRIGRGKGYYDRLLQNANIFKIGIVYDFQIMPAVPTTAYDQPVDIVISNRRLIYTKTLFEK